MCRGCWRICRRGSSDLHAAQVNEAQHGVLSSAIAHAQGPGTRSSSCSSSSSKTSPRIEDEDENDDEDEAAVHGESPFRLLSACIGTMNLPGKSAAGAAHSKTCRKFGRPWPTRQRRGVRRPSAAFDASPYPEFVRFMESPLAVQSFTATLVLQPRSEAERNQRSIDLLHRRAEALASPSLLAESPPVLAPARPP